MTTREAQDEDAGSSLANAVFGTGRWQIGAELRTLIHLRVASIIGCVF